MTQQAERTRTIKYVLADSIRLLLHRRRDTKKIKVPGCTKKIRNERREKRKTKRRKQRTNAYTQEYRTQGVAIAKNHPVSATKPRRGPCHNSCYHLPAFVGNGMKCFCCRCRASSPANKSTKTQTKLHGLGGGSKSGSTY